MPRKTSHSSRPLARLETFESRTLLSASLPTLEYTDIKFDPLPTISPHQPFTLNAHVYEIYGSASPTGTVTLIAIAFQDLDPAPTANSAAPLVIKLGDTDLTAGGAFALQVTADLSAAKRWAIHASYSGDAANYFTAAMVGPLSFTSTPQTLSLDIVTPDTLPTPAPHISQETPTDQNTALVTRLYRDLLGRDPEAQGLEQWTSSLAAGAITLQDVSSAIVHSAEYHSCLIRGFYQSILHRTADEAGLQGWLAAFDAGTSLEEIQAQFYGSTEYFAANGGSNAAIVNTYYQLFLHRDADETGQAYWTTLLNNGGVRSDVAAAIRYLSGDYLVESMQSTITQAYETYLHRTPDSQGLEFWTTQLRSGAAKELDFTLAIVSCPEYLSQP